MSKRPGAQDFRSVLQEQLGKWAEEKPEEPAFGGAGSGTLTRKQVLDHVERRTKLGRRLIDDWQKQAIAHVTGLDPD
jgi:hypothetical protein